MTPMHVFLNGEYLPVERACVSVLDRGFIFGDGVYEVIPVFAGVPFRSDEHLRRLSDSLEQVAIPNLYLPAEWKQIFASVIEKNGGGDQSLYVQVTRGVAPRDHVLNEEVQPTVFAMTVPLLEGGVREPVSAITTRDIRWERCYIKSISLLPNVLLRQQAAAAGGYEAILVYDGMVTEGAASNVFLVKDGRVVTPALGPRLLPGITRELLLELMRDAGITCDERRVLEHELVDADEIWLTSSTREIMPVTRLDGAPVGTGVPGPVWQRVCACYDEFKQRMHAVTEVGTNGG